MFAIAFDLSVRDTQLAHPKGVTQAYEDIARTLGRHGFERIQGSVYLADHEDLARLFAAISALRALDWAPTSIRDLRAFRVEQWSDFTATIKGTPTP